MLAETLAISHRLSSQSDAGAGGRCHTRNDGRSSQTRQWSGGRMFCCNVRNPGSETSGTL